MTSRPTELLSRIAVDPGICHGQPCVRGTRIMVWLVVQYMANGDSVDDILVAYPSLTREDVQACLAYAAELIREHVIPIEADSGQPERPERRTSHFPAFEVPVDVRMIPAARIQKALDEEGIV